VTRPRAKKLSKSAEWASRPVPDYVPRSLRVKRGSERADGPPHELTRVLMCRACARDTGIPGARYCDECRPRRLSDLLLAPADRMRMQELAQ
jgi:hypothetical protein